MAGIFATGYKDSLDEARRNPVGGIEDVPSAWSETVGAAFENFRNEFLSSSHSSRYWDEVAARRTEIVALGEDPGPLDLLGYPDANVYDRINNWLADGTITDTDTGFTFATREAEVYGKSFGPALRGIAHLRALRLKHGDKIRSDETIAANIRALVLETRDRTAQVIARGPGSAKLLGTIGGAITDPLILATLPLGGGFSLGRGFFFNAARSFAIESGIAAGVEIPIQAQVYEFKKFLGDEWTFGDAALNVLTIGLGAGAFRGVASLTIDSALTVLGKYSRLVKVDPAVATAEREAARQLLQTWVDVAKDSPLTARGQTELTGEALKANASATAVARAQVQAGEPVNVAKIVEGFEPEPEFRAADGVGDLESLDPTALEVDAKTFQFKADVDAEGVSSRLKGVSTFDRRLAGVAIVWESKAGRRFIVDGHQRVALAKRAIAAGQDPAEVRQASYVLREADGVTPAEARQVASIKNIAEGTGGPIDAAKVLRDLGPAGEAMLPPLPPTSILVRQARGLAALDDDAFEKIINKVVDERYGAIVGELIEDGKLQNAAIKVLTRTDPANQVQARSIVEQVRTAGLETRVTEDLFGTQVIAESLYLERAKVLDAAMKLARSDKATFGTLVRRERSISQTGGNQLDRAANEAKISQASIAMMQLTKLANVTGEVSDALTSAARQVAQGKKAGEVAEAFLETAKRALIGRDRPRPATGEPGPTGQAPAKRLNELKVDRNLDLNAEDAAIEARFIELLESTPWEELKARYAKTGDAQGGRVLSVDAAKELSPDYLANRAKSNAVHEPASAFIKRLYAERLTEAPGTSQVPLVIFTAGGTGAGKTTGLEFLKSNGSAQIIMDGNLPKFPSAKGKIQAALDAGKEVIINYVHRDPVEALVNGALKRARTQAAKFGTGRTLTVPLHAEIHAGANKTIRQLAEHYADEPRLAIEVVDNANGRGNAVVIKLADLPELDENQIVRQGMRALERARQNGDITEEIARAFRGAAEARGARVRGLSRLDQPGGGERAPAAAAGAAENRAADLLGDDTRAAQALADETRRRDNLRNAGQDSVETADPGDLFSAARAQADLVDETERLAALAEADDLAELHGDFLQVAEEVIDTAAGSQSIARPAREVFDELDELERGMDDVARCAFPHKVAA